MKHSPDLYATRLTMTLLLACFVAGLILFLVGVSMGGAA